MAHQCLGSLLAMHTDLCKYRDLHGATQRLLGFHLSEGVGEAVCRSLRYQGVDRSGGTLRWNLGPTVNVLIMSLSDSCGQSLPSAS